jgi:hypothetical protein
MEFCLIAGTGLAVVAIVLALVRADVVKPLSKNGAASMIYKIVTKFKKAA